MDLTMFTGKCTFPSMFMPAEHGLAGPNGPPLIFFFFLTWFGAQNECETLRCNEMTSGLPCPVNSAGFMCAADGCWDAGSLLQLPSRFAEREPQWQLVLKLETEPQTTPARLEAERRSEGRMHLAHAAAANISKMASFGGGFR